jgi:hypothetical protein
MKWVLLLLLSVVLFTACKKDKGSTNQLFLSKVFKNGLLQHEYIYGADKKPFRQNSFNTSMGQSNFARFRLYQYSAAGLLTEVTLFDKNNQFSYKYTFEYDASNHLTRMDDRADDNHIQFYYLFTYAGNNMSTYTLYNAANKKNVEAVLSYDGNGNPTKMIRRTFINPVPALADSATYSFEKKLPAHWSYFEMLPIIGLSLGEETFFDMICTASLYYHVDAPPTKTDKTFSNKIYDGQGYIQKQTISTRVEYVGPATVTNDELTYEYIKL